jgi:hypothetical protein
LHNFERKKANSSRARDRSTRNNTAFLKLKFFFFDIVRIWEFSPVGTDCDKCQNLSKRNVKLILKILSDLEPLVALRTKKSLYSTRSCVNWALFGTRGPLKRSFHSRFKLAHSCQKKPNLHTNSLNKLLLWVKFHIALILKV